MTFVKLGQVLSTRRDLLPPEFITELSRLQDDAPQVPWPQVEATLRAELGAEVDEVFVTFEREPLAAASIAQVHRATLSTSQPAASLAPGQPVVVKVCRPGVRAVVDRDLDIVLRLAARLQRGTSWGRSVGAVDPGPRVRRGAARGTGPADRGPQHDRGGRRGRPARPGHGSAGPGAHSRTSP